MAFTYSLPTIWSDTALIQLEKDLVFGSPVVVNRDYEGEIQAYGDSVKIHGVGDPTVGTYTKNSNITIDSLDDFEQVLNINQQDYYAFDVDDIDQVQMNPKLMGQAMRRAAYKMANSADVYVAGVLAAAVGTTATDANWTSTAWDGSDTTPVAISPATFSDPTAGQSAYEFLVQLGVYLDEVAVPREDRYCIVPPWFTGQLAIDLRLTGYEGYGQGTVLTDGFAAQPGKNGFAGRVAGFNVIASLNVPSDTFTTPSSDSPYLGADDASANYYQVIAGVPSAATFASQIVKTQAYVNPNQFGQVVRGLHVYGSSVVWPERLVGAYIAQGTATTH